MLKVLLVAAVVAGLVYAVMWALERRRASGAARSQHPSARRPGRRPPPRMVAPDDDEEFLRDLDRRRRQGDGPS